ncbi:MAG: aspartate--tRNA(Asn) ligase [Bdellovibrionales bacterium]|nr:aspartate--tRNA(Asn) ligase [Bdellovibrionales bacterium]
MMSQENNTNKVDVPGTNKTAVAIESITADDAEIEVELKSKNAKKRILADEVAQYLEQEIFIRGFVQGVRSLKAFCFVVVRDRTGTVQALLDNDLRQLAPTPGSYVEIMGKVVQHPQKKDIFDLLALQIKTLAKPEQDVPFLLNAKPKATLDHQLDFRAVSLRNPWIATHFKIKALVSKFFREGFEQQGFTEINTPKIVDGGTEGGAQVFSIDYFDKKVSLAQSPQLYKQISVAALERVYEIGPVFRAENSNTSRHLTEFTGLDFEMAFIEDQNDVMDALEKTVRYIFQKIPEIAADELKLLGKDIFEIDEIPRLSFADAMELVEKYNIDCEKVTLDKAMGEAILKEFGSRMAFITNYPRREKPFYIMTSPKNSNLTESFDLLIDGIEVCSGGQRIHDKQVLIKSMIMNGLNPENYSGYLQAFEYGMPPHGGAGLGLERLAQTILGLSNVREVTMFPRDVRRTSP